MFSSNGYVLPRFCGLVNNSFQQLLRKVRTLWLIIYSLELSSLSVTNPIKEGHKGICLVSVDMGFGQLY